MIEIQCPFCDVTGRVEAAVFTAAVCSLRCDACGITVDVDPEGGRVALPLAA